MKIAHIADVHVRGLSRHAEYKLVFTELARQIVEFKVDHLFVGGDIFHTKTVGISPEYIDFMQWWLSELSRHAELHLTLGNHDGNLVNLSRQDAVSPIVTTLQNPRVHLYKQSGVYQFAPGFNWCVFSLFDEEGWKNVKPVPGEVNIACYHGGVWGAKTETDWLVESGMTVDFFRDFDFCFLGDIHKMQFLDEKFIELEIDESELENYPGAEVIEEIDG